MFPEISFSFLTMIILAAVSSAIGWVIAKRVPAVKFGAPGSFLHWLGRKGFAAMVAQACLTLPILVAIGKAGSITAELFTAYSQGTALNLGIFAGGNSLEWIARMFGKGGNTQPPAAPGAAGLLLLALLGASPAHAYMTNDGTFFQPTQQEIDANWQQIGAQNEAFKEARKLAVFWGTDVAYSNAMDVAVYPIQIAWMLNNRAHAYIEEGEDGNGHSLQGLRMAARWLESAESHAKKERQFTDGKDGSMACLLKIESNAKWVADKIKAREKKTKAKK